MSISVGGELAHLLAATTLPEATAAELVRGAPELWLASDAPGVLAADLALCHPPLAAGEVRARAAPFADGGSWRLTVVAPDRRGLLATTTAALALGGHSVLGASAATWPALDVASHAVTVGGPVPDQAELSAIGARLQAGGAVDIPFTPAGGAVVTGGAEGEGRMLVTVHARDQMGLLSVICGWFSASGFSIEAAAVGGDGRMASDVFVVRGDGPLHTTALALVL